MLRVLRCSRGARAAGAVRPQLLGAQRRTFITNPFAKKPAAPAVPEDADKLPELSAAEIQRLEEEEIMRLINEETLEQSTSFFESIDHLYSTTLDWVNPCNYARAGISWVHTSFGLEWWASIAVVSVGVRLLLIPVQLFVMRNNARQALRASDLRQIDERERKALGNERMNEKERTLVQSSFTAERERIYKEGGFRPRYSFLGVVQAVPFGVIFYTTRSIIDATPLGGGAFWFPNIADPDTTLILPGVALAGLLVSSELNTAQQANAGQLGRWLGRVFSGVFMYMFYQAPAGMMVGFVIAGWMQALPGLLLRSGKFRKAVGMPKGVVGPQGNLDMQVTGWKAWQQRYQRWMAGDALEHADSLGGGLGQARHSVSKNVRNVSSFKVRK